MNRQLIRGAVGLGAIAALVGSATTAVASGNAAKSTTLYSSLVSPLPGNVPSQPFQAQQTNEFGNLIRLTNSGHLTSVVVTMSSWGCQSGGTATDNCVTSPGATFPVSITLNLYRQPVSTGPFTADQTTPVVPGTVITSVTKTFKIPYRPSQSSKCSNGDWFDGSQGCLSGKAVNITFSLDHDVPQTLVFGIVYSTSQYGPSPNDCDAVPTANCPIDSLNVGLSTKAPSKGGDPYPGTAFWDSDTTSAYCDGGAAGGDIFRLDLPDLPCWSPYSAAVQFIGS